jgi:signal transduction histidine kinase
MEIDRILLVILTAVTAGDGLGFNRAFLLLVDEDGRAVRGRMAVGPSHPDEAELIWKAMQHEGRSLGEILAQLSDREGTRNDGIMTLASKLVVPLGGSDNVVSRCLEEGASCVIERAYDVPEARDIADVLSNQHFLVVPLVAEERKLGAIIADNFVTGRKIRNEDVRLLESFASQAALAILNASLHRKLQERVKELEQAHEELTYNQIQLLRAEGLVAAGGLAATLIHDLKAPLVSIGLMARAASSDLAGAGPTKEILEKISAEIVRIEQYLKNFARSAGRGAKTEIVDISRLILDCLAVVRGVAAKGGIECSVDLNHGDARVRGSRVGLRQVIVNLLYNSIEAMPEGGKLAVATPNEQGVLKVSIEDTGTGIPEELRTRVFSPFFTTKLEGSGLGLVIAKRIVTGYGGRIALELKEGAGTRFSIYLPVVK